MTSLSITRSRSAVGVLALLFISASANVSTEHQARYQALLEELRCLVCQNQTLAESNAELAGDLRDRVSLMLEEGASDEEILSFMTERYGDFVRYRPPFNPRTYLLWLAPLFLLVGFLFVFIRFVLTRGKSEGKSAQ